MKNFVSTLKPNIGVFRCMRKLLILSFSILLIYVTDVTGQPKRPKPKNAPEPRVRVDRLFVVIDERLAVIREKPSLYATPIQRMRRGRLVALSGDIKQDEHGVRFYKIQVSKLQGWVQVEALANIQSKADEKRLARLIQGSSGFDKIERTAIFLKDYLNSDLRPAVLLLFGDLVEEVAASLSKDANRRLDEKEMQASDAPIESFYLSYSGLDRYRRLGITFLFNKKTMTYHYDGQSWKELLQRFPNTNEAKEAKKRLENLQSKMQ